MLPIGVSTLGGWMLWGGVAMMVYALAVKKDDNVNPAGFGVALEVLYIFGALRHDADPAGFWDYSVKGVVVWFIVLVGGILLALAAQKWGSGKEAKFVGIPVMGIAVAAAAFALFHVLGIRVNPFFQLFVA